MPRVTITAVAAALGISAMTVSRAMRGRPGVSPELADRIRETATRMGYRPDPEIGRLMHHLRRGEKSGLRASLCAVTDFTKENEPRYCARLHLHAARHAHELGFGFSVIRVAPAPGGWAAVLRNIRARGVEGILLLPLVASTALGAEGWDEFSVVSATSSVTSPRFHEVAPNHAANARLLIDHLAGQGFRRIGFVGLAPHARRTREALPAALAWHHARHRVRCEPILHEPDEHPDVVAWARRERPDVVLVGRPPDLPGHKAELEKAGIRVAWAQANSSAFFHHAPGLDERDDLIGAAAIDTLSSLVVRGERGIPTVPTSVSISGQWTELPATTLD